MSLSKSNRANRIRLWTNDPRCYWCGVVTVDDPHRPVERITPTSATLDHVYSLLTSRLYRRYGFAFAARSALVLACHRCNHKRSYADQQYRRGCITSACVPDYLRSDDPEFIRLWLGRPDANTVFRIAPKYAVFDSLCEVI